MQGTMLWRLSCDACDFAARVGEGVEGAAGWCEACQRAVPITHSGSADARRDGHAGGAAPRCPTCGSALSIETFRFEELYGSLQNLAAVLSAWTGDSEPLRELLPDRPRFLTDLDPPEPAPGDPEPVRAALRRLAEGRFAEARERIEELLGPDAEARLWRALAIARERLGDLAGAEEACTRALAREETERLRLMRGALRARRADLEAAREDFARAGDGHEARWNRAALAVLAAVAHGPELPAHDVLEAARGEAGAVSDYWSEPTVGRLLWTLLLERTRAARSGAAPQVAPERLLPAAEPELEYRTFWDRALVVHAYAVADMPEALERVAAPLAAELLEALAAEPALAHAAAREIRDAVARARAAVAAGNPVAARVAVSGLLARDDLRRYRVPCGACGRGSIGVEALEEDVADPI